MPPTFNCTSIFDLSHTSQIRDNWNERSSRGSRKHTSPAICRAGRVPLREAFRGSVITCSRNNERLILSSWLATPSLSLSLLSPFRSRWKRPVRRDLSTFRCIAFSVVLRARVLWLSDLLFRIHVLHAFIHFSSLSRRTFGHVSRMAISIRFVCGFEYALIAVGRYGSARRTGEAWEAALSKYSIWKCRVYSMNE